MRATFSATGPTSDLCPPISVSPLPHGPTVRLLTSDLRPPTSRGPGTAAPAAATAPVALPGLAGRLDYVRHTGATAPWLNPVFATSGY